MKEYIQKIIIASIQIFLEWVRSAYILLLFGLFTRISLVLIFFNSFYGYFGYTFLAIIAGIFLDLSISYILCLPFVIYRVLVSNKFFITTAGQAIYYILLGIQIFIITLFSALDLMIFKITKNRITQYLNDLFYYKQIYRDLISEQFYLVIFGCFIVVLCIIFYLKKYFSKIKFKYEPPFMLKFVIAIVFLLICHSLWFKSSQFNFKFNTNNRYVNILSDNIINNLMIIYKKPSIKIEKIDKNFVREGRTSISNKIGNKNVILFLIEDLSLENSPHLQNISRNGINFSNAFMCDKKHELQKILYADPIDKKCDIALAISKKYNAMFFNNFTKNKAYFFNELFYKCGFKSAKQQGDIYKKILDNSKQNFFFIANLKYNSQTTDNEISDFIKIAKKKAWFSKTIFIFAGIKSNFNTSKVADFDEYKVPIIFYGTDIDKIIINNIVSTVDIMSTVASLTGINYNTNSLGDNMFSGKKRAFIIENNTYCSLTKYQKNINFIN